jgi:hypothetical protein
MAADWKIQQSTLLKLFRAIFTQGGKEIELDEHVYPKEISELCDAYKAQYGTGLLWEYRSNKTYLFEQTMVVHCQKLEYDVYIGRPNPKVKGSNKSNCKWGNPFSEKMAGSRENAIEMYRLWILTQPQLMQALPELAGKVLGCWCAPQPCHGDVLVKLVYEYVLAPIHERKTLPISSEQYAEAIRLFNLMSTKHKLNPKQPDSWIYSKGNFLNT